MGSASVPPVEEQLREAGISLLNSPSSVDELLPLLDKAEYLLCDIEQAQPVSVKEALLPLMKALKADTLLKHSNLDVRVSVASCIHEITRITAPKEPYNDDLMKEIFKLTVSALENLSKPSTRCYEKAASIIYTVARGRSCVVMLDLECDALVIEMFGHFLKCARSDHSEDVLWAMEQIMTLLLDESEDISLELVHLLLASVRKENENAAPISWELAMRVISNCGDKLRPVISGAVQSMDAELEDFAPIVASLCQSTSGTNEQNDAKDSDEQAGADVLALSPRELAPGSDAVLLSTSDDRPGQTFRDEAMSASDSKSSRKSGLGAAKIPRKRGRRPNSLMNPEEGYDQYWSVGEKKVPKLPGRKKTRDSGVYDTLAKVSGIEEPNLQPDIVRDRAKKLEVMANGDGEHNSTLVPVGLLKPELENLLEPSERSLRTKCKDKKLPGKQQSSRKRRKHTEDNVECGLHTQDVFRVDKDMSEMATDKIVEKTSSMTKMSSADECHSKGMSAMDKLQEKKQSSSRKRRKAESDNLEHGFCIQEASAVDKMDSDVTAKKIVEKTPTVSKVSSEDDCRTKEMPKSSKLQEKQQGSSRKRRKAATENLESELHTQDASEVDGGISGVAISKIVEKTPLVNKLSSEDESHSKGTPKTRRTWKRKGNKEEESKQQDLCEHIVGRRIKVWWPMDKRFYEGTVKSYDYKRKRYQVVYTDGDEERLNLPKQRWEFIEDDNDKIPKQNAETPEQNDKHSTELIRNLKRKKSKSTTDSNPYQLVKRTGASSSALKLEAADGYETQAIVVKVEDYMNEVEDSEATLSEDALSETTL